MSNNDNGWVVCEKCGKRLMRRRKNGIFEFKFGKQRQNKKGCVVQMEILGSIRMKCIGENCDHVNQFEFFPQGLNVNVIESSENEK